MFIIRLGNTDELRIAYAVIPSDGGGCSFVTADSAGKVELFHMNTVTIIRAPIPAHVEASWNEVLLQDARTTAKAENA